MTPSHRVTRLVKVGTVYKVITATLPDFYKMEKNGDAVMVAEYRPDSDTWIYFDGETPPPFKFQELI